MAFSSEAAKQQDQAILAKDSGGGFFIEDDDEQECSRGSAGAGSEISKRDINSATSSSSDARTTATSAAASGSSNPVASAGKCQECNEKLTGKPFLKINFQLDVCDSCRDDRGKHRLITRTEAKSEFLLKDCDMDRREPALSFIVKKNPHERAKGDMRLYLRSDVVRRAIEVHGSAEAIDEEREKRTNKRQDRKHKEFNKKITQLRMSVRSSLYARSSDSRDHVHQFGPEVCVDEDNDMYERSCQTCDYVDRFEKM